MKLFRFRSLSNLQSPNTDLRRAFSEAHLDAVVELETLSSLTVSTNRVTVGDKLTLSWQISVPSHSRDWIGLFYVENYDNAECLDSRTKNIGKHSTGSVSWLISKTSSYEEAINKCHFKYFHGLTGEVLATSQMFYVCVPCSLINLKTPPEQVMISGAETLLVVSVSGLKATGLKKSFFGKPNAYVKLFIVPRFRYLASLQRHYGQKAKTFVQNNVVNPIWVNEVHVFHATGADLLELEVLNRGGARPTLGKFLGKVSLPLASIIDVVGYDRPKTITQPLVGRTPADKVQGSFSVTIVVRQSAQRARYGSLGDEQETSSPHRERPRFDTRSSAPFAMQECSSSDDDDDDIRPSTSGQRPRPHSCYQMEFTQSQNNENGRAMLEAFNASRASMYVNSTLPTIRSNAVRPSSGSSASDGDNCINRRASSCSSSDETRSNFSSSTESNNDRPPSFIDPDSPVSLTPSEESQEHNQSIEQVTRTSSYFSPIVANGDDSNHILDCEADIDESDREISIDQNKHRKKINGDVQVISIPQYRSIDRTTSNQVSPKTHQTSFPLDRDLFAFASKSNVQNHESSNDVMQTTDFNQTPDLQTPVIDNHITVDKNGAGCSATELVNNFAVIDINSADGPTLLGESPQRERAASATDDSTGISNGQPAALVMRLPRPADDFDIPINRVKYNTKVDRRPFSMLDLEPSITRSKSYYKAIFNVDSSPEPIDANNSQQQFDWNKPTTISTSKTGVIREEDHNPIRETPLLGDEFSNGMISPIMDIPVSKTKSSPNTITRRTDVFPSLQALISDVPIAKRKVQHTSSDPTSLRRDESHDENVFPVDNEKLPVDPPVSASTSSGQPLGNKNFPLSRTDEVVAVEYSPQPLNYKRRVPVSSITETSTYQPISNNSTIERSQYASPPTSSNSPERGLDAITVVTTRLADPVTKDRAVTTNTTPPRTADVRRKGNITTASTNGQRKNQTDSIAVRSISCDGDVAHATHVVNARKISAPTGVHSNAISNPHSTDSVVRQRCVSPSIDEIASREHRSKANKRNTVDSVNESIDVTRGPPKPPRRNTTDFDESNLRSMRNFNKNVCLKASAWRNSVPSANSQQMTEEDGGVRNRTDFQPAQSNQDRMPKVLATKSRVSRQGEGSSSNRRRDTENDGNGRDKSSGAGPQRNAQVIAQREDEETLPPNWQRSIDSHSRVYYINHNTRTTTWTRPSRTDQSSQPNSDVNSQLAQLDRRYQSLRRTICDTNSNSDRPRDLGLDPDNDSNSNSRSSNDQPPPPPDLPEGTNQRRPSIPRRVGSLADTPGCRFLLRRDFCQFIKNYGPANLFMRQNAAVYQIINRIRSDPSKFERYQHSRDLITLLNFFAKKQVTLPPGWEQKLDQFGQAYFIDHGKRSTTFIDPRLPLEKGDTPRQSSRADTSSRPKPLSSTQNGSSEGTINRLSVPRPPRPVPPPEPVATPVATPPINQAVTSNFTPLSTLSYNDRVVAFLRQPNIDSVLLSKYSEFATKHQLKRKLHLIQRDGARVVEKYCNDVELVILLSIFEDDIQTYANNLAASQCDRARDSTPDAASSSTEGNESTNDRQFAVPTGLPAYGQQAPRHGRDFEAKLRTFHKQMVSAGFGHGPGKLRMKIRRSHVIEDAFEHVMRQSAHSLQKDRLYIKFTGEEGLDYGGPAREFFFLLSKQLFNPYYGLFEYSASDTYTLQVSPASRYVDNAKNWFRFCGRILALVLIHQHLLDVFFARTIYKALLKQPFDLSDLEGFDPEYYQGLTWILVNDITHAGLGLTFSATDEVFGQVTERELKPGGEEIVVTEGNKREYVECMIKWRVERGVGEQINHLVRGFHETLALHMVSLFDARDLELVIAGTADIDLKDWRANTEYRSGYHNKHKVVEWFWEALDAFTNEQNLRLLQFVTGTSSIPCEGFSALRGSTGLKKFTIDCWGTAEMLPRAHTCFNRLDLPPYRSFTELQEKLIFAAEETSTFGIE